MSYFPDIICADSCGCGVTGQEDSSIVLLDRMVMAADSSASWEEEYLTRLTPMFDGITEDALDEVIDWVKSRDTIPSVEEFDSSIRNILGDEFSKVNTEVAKSFVDESYRFYNAAEKLAPGVETSFGGADLRSIDALAGTDNQVLSKFLKNKGTQSTLSKFLKERYFEQGEAMFGRESGDAIRDLRQQLGGKLKNVTHAELDRIIETSVQRIRNRGQLQQLQTTGALFLQVFEPTRECEFCQAMHLKKIPVKAAVARVGKLDELSEEQFLQQFKIDRNKPELVNLERFVAEGFLPPYHPHCRGRIRIVR